MKIIALIMALMLTVPPAFCGGGRAFVAASTTYIDVGVPARTTNMTICAWMKPNTGETSTVWISKYNAVPCEYELGLSANYPFIRMDAEPTGMKYVYESVAFDGYGYYQLCAVFDGALKEYLNGVYKGTTTSYTRATKATANLNFGRRPYTGAESYATGVISHVQLFNTNLSANEFLEMATGVQNSLRRSKLTAEWTLMEPGADPTFKDTVASTYPGTNHSSTESMNGPKIFYATGGHQQ